ncbi:DNA-directed RNA polymerase i polypeptide 2 [Trichosporon asahii var. asahii CBS 2479]|uniref:DNA-directed RNA polymerase subunit beta n=1 Tax=Trichosporon asahii var. asahii (strain ATCC 90039 / CBS 2479 / JCM 2466 / KCTC 7840 / NBRC 103889/ NCYC 2677 / UAMH 7654) TaxID=1186058 RepID=J5SQ16_TRIAS|nr:DNA-directed RNA polymerase i polypeptide 2 [Trichosporon asahii var. asahii CBS 2479]EJT46891.1 DNA-directed RNA polymerase i polypeptide 2 [Trichosporon asahii var. asahii CBS 2479]
MTFDPLSPSKATSSKYPDKSTFRTLTRERAFRHPNPNGPDYATHEELVRPHIESFDALTEGDDGQPGLLQLGVQDIGEKIIFDGKSEEGLPYGNKITYRISQVALGKPLVSDRDKTAVERRIFPSEARERLTTYRSRLTVTIKWKVTTADGTTRESEEVRECGMLPIMVKSARCNIRGMPAAELVKHGEESSSWGGYFIINGNEKLVRYLILPRRHHPINLYRPSFAKRGVSYTPYGCQIRCVRPDQSACTNTIHYLSNGGATLRFAWRKVEYMIPLVLILKALVDASDLEIFEGLVQGEYDNTFLTDRVELLLRGQKSWNLQTGTQCLDYLGDKFRVVMNCPDDWTNVQVGSYLLKKVVLVHLPQPREKFRMLLFMLRKLYSMVAGTSCPDNPDSPQHHEVLLPGFLYAIIIKERFDESLNAVKAQINMDMRQGRAKSFDDPKYFPSVLTKVNFDVGSKLSYFLATGNLVSPTGLDLQQTSGFTVVAEKLNFYRYLSHFRCIHRGAFFAELKTTAVRKLLPESWGFLCPVHTPDGSPCGLLNHLSHTCQIVVKPLDTSKIPQLLSAHGMTQVFATGIDGRTNVVVQLDGRVIGWASPTKAKELADLLRKLKTEGDARVPLDLEVGYVPVTKGGQYPGLYLFGSRSRMMRPVTYLENDKMDHVGTFEQVYMDIAIKPEEVEKGVSTHVELDPTSMLSVLANLTPFSDFNQSPRNMYQCQMGKQTMGTPSTALQHRTDNKFYRIQNPQTPIVRPSLHNDYGFDDFPNATNAILAVISYTGYDMEDAMILNKSSHERGFGYGTVYKADIFDLKDAARSRTAAPTLHFGLGRDVKPDSPWRQFLDQDGLPQLGTRVKSGDPLCAYIDDTTGRTKVHKYKGDETAYIDEVRVLGSDLGDSELQKIHIKLRIPRSPVIGDKFSSRHGQKGVCSVKFKDIDMPFSESGMRPDVIINPHAFPSRMTIGMFVEMLAAKAGAVHGQCQDATPFKFSDAEGPVEFFGEQLRKAGYNYHGNEPMYSGVTGEEMRADIFLAPCAYQRLRHQVNDKYQARSTGPVDPLTRQPVKGRKRAGGIRFGEMERDALIAHGTSFLLQDRLMNCSDYSTAWVCRGCGSLISLGFDDSVGPTNDGRPRQYCRICERNEQPGALDGAVQDKSVGVVAKRESTATAASSKMDVIAVPYVFRYLCAEMACMGIRLNVSVA